MSPKDLEKEITQLWEGANKGATIDSNSVNIINKAAAAIESGLISVVSKHNNEWIVNNWVKHVILLAFRIRDNQAISGSPNGSQWYDKIMPTTMDYEASKVRIVPPAYIREMSFIGNNVVVMPSFINVGAYIDEKTMIDSWATVGSCARIGKGCHISSNVCIGGVLEPAQAMPVIIEDNCFIGAGSNIAEGIMVGENSVLGLGTNITQSTKIIDRETGDVHFGKVPANSVVVSGYNNSGQYPTACALIIKKINAETKNKTAINELLRD